MGSSPQFLGDRQKAKVRERSDEELKGLVQGQTLPRLRVRRLILSQQVGGGWAGKGREEATLRRESGPGLQPLTGPATARAWAPGWGRASGAGGGARGAAEERTKGSPSSSPGRRDQSTRSLPTTPYDWLHGSQSGAGAASPCSPTWGGALRDSRAAAGRTRGPGARLGDYTAPSARARYPGCLEAPRAPRQSLRAPERPRPRSVESWLKTYCYRK